MSLTTTMGVKIGPIVLGTLFKHYLERHNVTRDSKARNELLFDEAFIVVKVSPLQLLLRFILSTDVRGSRSWKKARNILVHHVSLRDHVSSYLTPLSSRRASTIF